MLRTLVFAAALPGLSGASAVAQEVGPSSTLDLAFRNWLVVVRDRVVTSARRERWTTPGRVLMTFRVFRDGSVGDVAALDSTSRPVAERGVRAVRDAYLFPPIPEFAGRDSIPSTVALHFTDPPRHRSGTHRRS